MELLAAFVGGILGVIGAFAGVWLSNLYQSRAQKQQTLRDTTISLYAELTGAEMLTSRMKASKILDENAQKQMPLTISELSTNIDTAFEDWYPVGRVLTFFEKLGVYLKAGYLDEELARELMGGVAIYWYDHYFANLIQDVDLTQIERSDPLKDVNEWLEPYRTQLKYAKREHVRKP